jgi:hypothetical protein
MANKHYWHHDSSLKPHCIYLYYFKRRSSKFYCKEFLEHIAPSAVAGEINTMIGEIDSGQLDPYIGTCTRKSYFVVVLDDPVLRLKAGDAVRIRRTYLRGKGTFRDGHDLPAVPGHNNISGFYCFNHMIHRLGHVLEEGEEEGFKVRLNHDPTSLRSAFAPGLVGFLLFLAWLIHIRSHEDTGTNTGPPTPPPE